MSGQFHNITIGRFHNLTIGSLTISLITIGRSLHNNLPAVHKVCRLDQGIVNIIIVIFIAIVIVIIIIIIITTISFMKTIIGTTTYVRWLPE